MPALHAAVQADQVLLQNTNYQLITDLSVNLAAGVRYSFEAVVFISAGSSTTGHAISINHTAAMAHLRYAWEIPTSITETLRGAASVILHSQAASASIASTGPAAPFPTLLRGAITSNGGGALDVRIRAEDIDSAITVHRGSWLTVVN